jgi:hypothetical protein
MQSSMILCDGCGNGGKLKQVGYSDSGAGKPVMLCKSCRHPRNVDEIRARLEVKPLDVQKKAKQAEDAAKRQREQDRTKNKAEQAKIIKNRGKAKTKPGIGKTGKTARKKAAKAAKRAS